jgi:hypothetical protein
MQLVIEYRDRHANEHRLERRFYLTVTGQGQSPSNDSQSFARLHAPDGRDLALLRQQMSDSFSKDDLLGLVLHFGLNPEDFGERSSIIARQLIAYVVQTDQLDKLILLCQEYRDHLDW